MDENFYTMLMKVERVDILVLFLIIGKCFQPFTIEYNISCGFVICVLFYVQICSFGLPRWLSGKESACQCRRHRFDPWVRISPGGGNGNPLQYSCLENPMDRGAWQTTVHRVIKSRTQLRLSTHTFPLYTLC